MVRLLLLLTLLLILLVAFTVPAFAEDGNVPKDNLGQNWDVPPGERDDTVRGVNDLAKDLGMSPGQWSVDWKRDHQLIPGWEGNGGANNPYNNP